MKKITAVIICLSVFAGILASCSGMPGSKETTTRWEYDPLAEEYFETSEASSDGETETTRADVIYEKAEGLNFLTITKTAKVNYTCGVTVKGQAKSDFTIEIYEDAKNRLELGGLEQKTSDDNGIVTWTFTIPEGTKPGVKVIIVRQQDSENYARTAFTVV